MRPIQRKWGDFLFFDIIVGAILILTMVSGFRKGFVYTFSHTLGWLGAMAAAFLLSPWLRGLLTERTELDSHIHESFADKLSLSSDCLNSSADSFPLIMGRSVNTAAGEAADLLSDKLTSITMIVISFLLLFFAVKIVLFFLTIALSRKERKGFAGFFDGLLGLVAGMIRGVIFVFLFLALLLPAVNLMSPASTDLVLSSLKASHFARTLYDSNFVVLIINDFLI